MAAQGRLGFSFGIFPYTRFHSIQEAVEVVQAGDELGYEAVGLPEHLLPPAWPGADLATKLWYDLPVLAAYLAAATKRIRFLTSVLVIPYHHPVALAKALATLDVLSNGRVLCGAGTGWMRAEFRRLGIPFAQRGAITDEYLRAMIELWMKDAPAFAGRYVSFDDVSFFPKPVQRPHIPIIVGGSGPRPYRRVAELGQGWLPMTATLDDLRHGVAEIRALMHEQGRDPSSLWIGYTGFGFGDDPQVQQMRRHAGDHTARSDHPSPSMERPDDVVAAIEPYRAAGVTCLSVGFPWQSAAELIGRLEWFSREVMPAWRRSPGFRKIGGPALRGRSHWRIQLAGAGVF